MFMFLLAAITSIWKCVHYKGKEKKKAQKSKSLPFILTSLSVALFNLCADRSKECFPPTETECVPIFAMCFQSAFTSFSPLTKYLRTCSTLKYLTYDKITALKATHSINSPDNSPFSHSVLSVLILPCWSFQPYISL